MKVVIIEDEKLAADKLIEMLHHEDNTIQVAAVIDNVVDAVQWLAQNNVDLIFLDIHLGDDSSFRIFDKVNITTQIVVTTAYNQYAIQAFKLNSIDYLLKPFSQEELNFALNKFRTLKADIPDYRSIFETIQQQKSYQERFMVVSGQKIKSILTQDIAYFLSEGRYAKLVTHTNEKYLIDQSLENIFSKIDPNLFFRVNRQAIVGFKSIQQMIIWSKSRVKLELKPTPEEDIIVSIDKSGDFKKWLNR
ncbi:LytTR family DNA-binding domain-containing protein [Flavobacterium sp.]|uniref:LytR/AlgR family response regulator transcription factor n=1 Tax=Flavobacterium sp. TaxID=239 RepID=UPI00261DABE6|nr:LytTR family DNA-binding domain-containing protein [Flavobacterium sp.]